METRFEFKLKCVNDQYGNGWWSGLEPHLKKNFGYIIFQEDGKFSLEVREIKISSTSKENHVSWQRSAVSEIATISVDFGDLSDNVVVALGVLIQGRNDWSGTSFTSTDGKSHPEDATWDDIFWLQGGTLGRCPSCFNELVLDVAHYRDPENHDQWTSRVLGQRCVACDALWKENMPVPRAWTVLITTLKPGIYSDDFMSEKQWLKDVFGVDSFPPESPYGPYVIEHPELNHFDRISGSDTVMWSYPCIRLFWDGCTWEIFNREDAITRMKVKIRGKGHNLNRNTQKMIEMLRISIKHDPAKERAKKIHELLLRSDGRAAINFSIDEGDSFYEHPGIKDISWHNSNQLYGPTVMLTALLGFSERSVDIIFEGRPPKPVDQKVQLLLVRVGKKYFVGAYQFFADNVDNSQSTRNFYFVLVTEDEANEIMKEEEE